MNSELSRREFLGLFLTSIGLTLGGCETSYRQTFEGQLKEGEWVSKGSVKIAISNNGDSSVKEVRIRSGWRIIDMQDRDVDNKTRTGVVNVGAVLIAEGRIKGFVGVFGDPTFMVIRKEEILSAASRGVARLEDSNHELYYINNRYSTIIEADLNRS